MESGMTYPPALMATEALKGVTSVAHAGTIDQASCDRLLISFEWVGPSTPYNTSRKADRLRRAAHPGVSRTLHTLRFDKQSDRYLSAFCY
jgi:hypothetical protein